MKKYSMQKQNKKPYISSAKRLGLSALVVAVPLALTACNSTKEVLSHGYQMNEETLALVPEGSSREQVLLSLGTPSTTQQNEDGSETFYYISQKKSRPIAFARAKVIDQRILAIYMDSNNTVSNISNYGLKDGRVFDFISRVTPTGGKDLSFVGQLLGAASSVANPLGGRS